MARILDLLDDCVEELRKDGEFRIEDVDDLSSSRDECGVAFAVHSGARADGLVSAEAILFPCHSGNYYSGRIFRVSNLGASASGKELERRGQNRRGARVGAHGALPNTAASDLYGNARDVCGNGDCIEPISRAGGDRDIGDCLSAEDTAGRKHYARDVWTGVECIPAGYVAAGSAALLGEMSGRQRQGTRKQAGLRAFVRGGARRPIGGNGACERVQSR